MSATPVNLNRARKAKARIAKKAKASENAIKFGQSKARKTKDETERAKTRHRVDQHRLSED
jgi:hypothetical protein